MVRSSLLARLVLGLAVGLFPVTASLAIAAPPQSAATQTPVLAEEDFLTTARVLSQSLQVIHDRTIKSRSFQQLAVAGLRGLSTIDSDLAIDIERSVIRVTLRNRSVLGVPLPEVDASWAWAGMLVATVRELRDQSPALAAAPLEALHTALISGALEGLDAHTRYDPPGEAEKHRSRRNGFSGIGVRYVREGEAIRIREVMAAGPSDGLLRADDLVTHVDGQPLAGMEMADMSHYLRGPRRSKVALTIRRGAGTVRDVTIVRDRVVPQSVTAEVRNGVAVLHIHRFNIATVQSVREAVEGAQTKTGDLLGVVLDLRGNPGGLLNQAHGVADLFIDEGVLVTTRGRHPRSRQSYQASVGDILKGRPMVVLVDGRSASSAEILAAALKDNGRAALVGTNSYGKGTVQTIARLANGGELKLTWSRFHSPAGYAIQDLGVMPSLCLSDVAEAEIAVDSASASSLIAGVGTPVAHAVHERWGTVPLSAKMERQTLRDTCPRERRAGMIVDVEVAVRMVRAAVTGWQQVTIGR